MFLQTIQVPSHIWVCHHFYETRATTVHVSGQTSLFPWVQWWEMLKIMWHFEHGWMIFSSLWSEHDRTWKWLTSDYFSKVGIWLAEMCRGLLFNRPSWESQNSVTWNIAMKNVLRTSLYLALEFFSYTINIKKLLKIKKLEELERG